ncbi:MAG: AmmeMemoRadiSam system protein B [Sedimentisphaerales bacterium]|nr:AmmeMemoRadiSam system protein B [Sedimentisphaerales bacterium]
MYSQLDSYNNARNNNDLIRQKQVGVVKVQARRPIVAGQFYPDRQDLCLGEIKQCIQEGAVDKPLAETIVAGIVPHAGWTFSGPLAAMVFSAIKQQNKQVHTFVVFGAAHGYFGQTPAVYDKGAWLTPLGEIAIDQELADSIVETGTAAGNSDVHRNEHSIEVQIPFIQHLFPGAKILPILVPQWDDAVKLGVSTGRIIKSEKQKTIVCIGSTDLTHYGPRYGFTPMGVGAEALNWAREVNDKKFIDLAINLEAEQMLASAAENCNACGPGAAAAAVAAAKELGKTSGFLLAHTNSNEVMLRKMGSSGTDAVGYAAIIF